MAIRAKAIPGERCARCLMRNLLCLCEVAKEARQTVSTRVSLLPHWREIKKTTNTARLLELVLEKSAIHVWGERGKIFDGQSVLGNEETAFVLFPTADAELLTPEWVAHHRALGRPFHLIVPDGTWHQAQKIATKVAAFKDLPKVKLPAGEPSLYRLRESPHLEKVSTFEAVARVLGLTEGPEIQTRLVRFFSQWVERVLWSRGKLSLSQCEFPVPEAALAEFRMHGARGSAMDLEKRAQAKKDRVGRDPSEEETV